MTRPKFKMIHKVSEIPFFAKGERIPQEMKDKFQLNGSAYRMAFARGLGGSIKEKTWNKELHMHSCCGAKVNWRHHGDCPRLGNRNDPDDYSDLKDTS